MARLTLPRSITHFLLGGVAAIGVLSACQDAPDAPAPGDTNSANMSEAQDSPTQDLQSAAQQAQTPQVQQSYLVRDPGPGKLTPEIINQASGLSGTSLRAPKIAPSGEFVTVLQGRADDANQLDLWAYDLASGEGRRLVSSTDLLGAPEELSEEEKNRRERARQYGRGIISYNWVGDNLLLFPLGGDIYLYDLEKQESRQVTATNKFETDPKVSDDGSKVAYVRANELYIKDLETGLERQLSSGSTDVIRNATASFVVQEELGRQTGYWMSDDASRLAYTQIDESPIAIESRLEFSADGVKRVDQRYPFTGTPNATIKLGVVSARGGKTRWLDLGDDTDVYLTRAAWAPDNRMLYVGVLSRDQKTHTIYSFDTRSGARKALLTETSPTWVNIDSEMKVRENGHIVWAAERADRRQVFDISPEGAVTALTPPDILVNSIACQTDDALFVRGWKENALSSHIFKISTIEVLAHEDGEGNDANQGQTEKRQVVTQITKGDGQHSGRFDKACTRYVGTYSSVNTPPQTRAFNADGTPLAWLSENPLNDSHPYAPYLESNITPEFGQIAAEDGTDMDYALYKPLDLKPGEKRASVTIVYNGPGVQRVINRWSRQELPRMLAHHGFVVFMVDGRAGTNRGKAFEDHVYRAMGKVEVEDQATGAYWLKAQNFIDPDRMGVYGWSYGGYMTLHMLGQTDLYESGVSGAPVTDWSLYDTAYTERYLGSPDPESDNYTSGAYEDGNVLAHLDGLTEPVLLIHGMADDNVIFRHSILLMDEMQKRGQHNLRVMTYPGEKHGFRKAATKTHRDRQILEFFLDTLDINEGG